MSPQAGSVQARQRWLRYWLVYWSLGLAEQVLVVVTWLLPAYSLLRTAFLLWCMAPLPTNGADTLFYLVKQLNIV